MQLNTTIQTKQFGAEKTDADLEGVGKFDVDIDPWVVMIGVGKKF